MNTQQPTTGTTQPYWSNCKPGDNDSQRYCQRNRDDLTYWFSKLPKDNDTLLIAITVVSTRTGLSRHMTERAFQGAAIMKLLPHLRKQVLTQGHLEMRYLSAIDDCLTGVAEEQLKEFDAALTWFFTPEYQDQTLPSIKEMKAFIEQLKLKHCPGYSSSDSFIFRHLTIRHGNDGMADLTGLVTKEEGKLITTALDKTAKKYDIDRVDALIKILTEKINVTATLNYWTHDPNKPPSYLDGAGNLIFEEKLFNNLPIKHQDLTGIEQEESEHYRPTKRLKTAVRLRDGICRFPDCNKPADTCDIDHVVEFGKNGGKTILSNLQCLCRTHHNLKTDGDLTIFMDHYGICHWHMPNGQVRITTPQGPEAHYPKAAWAQTWKTYRTRPKTTDQAKKNFQQQTHQKTQEAKTKGAIKKPTTPPHTNTTPTPTSKVPHKTQLEYQAPQLKKLPALPPVTTSPHKTQLEPQPTKLRALPAPPTRLALPAPPPRKRKRKPPNHNNYRPPKGFFNHNNHTPDWVKDLQNDIKQQQTKEKENRITEKDPFPEEPPF